MKYAGVLEKKVILVVDAEKPPIFQPTLDGREVKTVEIYNDENVCIGMSYTEEEGFRGECPKETQPEPTEQELVQAEMLLNQIEIMQRQSEQDEVLAEILLNQMGV